MPVFATYLAGEKAVRLERLCQHVEAVHALHQRRLRDAFADALEQVRGYFDRRDLGRLGHEAFAVQELDGLFVGRWRRHTLVLADKGFLNGDSPPPGSPKNAPRMRACRLADNIDTP